jgi:hypothetical protein
MVSAAAVSVVLCHLASGRWEALVDKAACDAIFHSLEGAETGVVGGVSVKSMMEESGLEVDVLRQCVDPCCRNAAS